MNDQTDYPLFEDQFPELNLFILKLVEEYRAEKINSWDDLDLRVKNFFSPKIMDNIETKAAGWKKMASYSDGITLTHVTCVFLGMFMLPEFKSLSSEQQQIAKWIIFFHDIDKFHTRGKKDTMHAFHSAVIAAKDLPKLGFPVTDKYLELIDAWSELTYNAYIDPDGEGVPKPDNRKLPEIFFGIDQLFNENSPAALITKTVLLHISLDADKNYPTPSPLTTTEAERYIDPNLFPLLRVMMLSDNEGWSLFEPKIRAQQRNDTLKVFAHLKSLIIKERVMDKQFWVSIAKNDYKIPEGHTLKDLTETLFGYLGSTDPELRDDIGYIVYANFLKREMYSQEAIREHVNALLANLENGIGETETDSVFLRTFSVLFLAEIVYNDNKKPLLDKAQVGTILSKALSYLEAEKDPRGFIPVKGWAHALAHTADLLRELGKNQILEKDDLETILQGIANKIVHSTNWVYIHGEDDRLANAVIVILQRDMISTDFLKNWLKSLVKPENSWKGSYADDGQSKAFHNTRNFLRSVLLAAKSTEDLPDEEQIEATIFDALTNLKPF